MNPDQIRNLVRPFKSDDGQPLFYGHQLPVNPRGLPMTETL